MENKDITENLTEQQKEALIADAGTSDKTLASLGAALKFTDCGDLTAASAGAYPSYRAICNSWNPEAFKNLWQTVARTEKQKDGDVIISPRAGVCNSPYSGGSTEEPYLAAAYIAAFAEGVKKEGLTPAVDCRFAVEDLWHMDEKFSQRAFYEYYMSPFANLPSGTAFTFPDNKYRGEYSQINTVKVKEFLRENATASTVLVRGADENSASGYLSGGNLLLESRKGALENAFDGADGNVKRDAACERAARFAFQVKAEKESLSGAHIESNTVTPLYIAEQSCVLLKNENNILPLKKGARLAAVGGLSDEVNARGFSDFCGRDEEFKCSASDGFSFDEDISPDLVKNAADKARMSDYTVLFLGFNENGCRKALSERSTNLPANMLGLYYEITAQCKNVILVVSSDYYVDLTFAKSAKAVLLCPATGRDTVQALYNILTGATNPSGRLAQTRYSETDANFRMLKNLRAYGGLKSGVFAGYRAGNDKSVLWPFGYGLSYTRFEYSDIQPTEDGVKFTLKNVGDMDGYEVVQAYLGKSDSGIVRPQRVLNAFLKVYLKRGESKVCELKIIPSSLKVFSDGKYVTEGGKYAVYVGSSPLRSDIKLESTVKINGEKIRGDGEKADMYMRGRSNIFSGGYTFGKVKPEEIKGKRTLAGGAMLAFIAVFVALLGGAAQLAGYIDLFEFDLISIISLVLFALVAGIAILLIIIGGLNVMVSKSKGVVVTTGEAKGVPLPQNPYEKLFAELYGPDKYYYGDDEKKPEKAEKPEKKIEEPVAEQKQDDDFFFGKYDPSLTFIDECAHLNSFLSENGINAGLASSRCILSALAASRIVILGGNSVGLERALSRYFGCEPYSVNLGDVNDTQSLLGAGLSAALKNAADNPDVLHIVSLYGASDDRDLKLFKPFIKCAYVNERLSVNYKFGVKDGGIIIPPNVWFILVPDAVRGIGFGDKELCGCASMLAPELAPCEKSYAKSSYTLGYCQFMRMVDKIVRYEGERYSLSEDHCWKKIDRFVRLLSRKCGYSLDNRDSLSIERFSAVYLACDGEQNNALDGSVACKIALPASLAMKSCDDEEENIFTIADSVFDEYGNVLKVLNLYKHNAR